jgi:hypothetical protein
MQVIYFYEGRLIASASTTGVSSIPVPFPRELITFKDKNGVMIDFIVDWRKWVLSEDKKEIPTTIEIYLRKVEDNNG